VRPLVQHLPPAVVGPDGERGAEGRRREQQEREQFEEPEFREPGQPREERERGGQRLANGRLADVERRQQRPAAYTPATLPATPRTPAYRSVRDAYSRCVPPTCAA